uniref:Uncharacterized protein n=1 Tax=Malurus cyaneus samueli TaxID=2593467 RepID=A0A8C5X5Z2_9PASS
NKGHHVKKGGEKGGGNFYLPQKMWKTLLHFRVIQKKQSLFLQSGAVSRARSFAGGAQRGVTNRCLSLRINAHLIVLSHLGTSH